MLSLNDGVDRGCLGEKGKWFVCSQEWWLVDCGTLQQSINFRSHRTYVYLRARTSNSSSPFSCTYLLAGL